MGKIRRHKTVSRMAKEGKTFTQIADECGTTVQAIYSFCKRQKIYVARKKYEHGEIAEFLKTHSHRETMQKFGCSSGTVENIAKEFNIRKTVYGHGQPPSKKYRGIDVAARHYGITMRECWSRLKLALGKEPEICINLLDETSLDEA